MMTGIYDNVVAQNSGNDGEIYYRYAKHELAFTACWRNFLGKASYSTFLGKGAGLTYNLSDGTTHSNYTLGLAADYTYNISNHFGLVSGVGIINYGGKAAGNFSDEYLTFDIRGDELTYSYKIEEYKEQQSLTMIMIPLMAKYSSKPFGEIEMRYFVAGGMKFGIPFGDKTEISASTLTTTGHYEFEDELYDDLPQHGFVTGLKDVSEKSQTAFKFSVIASIEAGLRVRDKERMDAMVSLYCDFGLQNMKQDDRHLVEFNWQNPEKPHFNSIKTTGRVNMVRIASAGLKIGIILNWYKKDSK
ncbi:MAG: PorT family protein [Prevotellaceae bacterium]|nr:PorT family protein [Prevotellaceae bacterium]